MFLVQAVVPASIVFMVFILAHLFVENEGSGIYLPETNWDGDEEEVFRAILMGRTEEVAGGDVERVTECSWMALGAAGYG